MNSVVKRLLILGAIGSVFALSIYAVRLFFGAPDAYQNSTPPVSAHATPDKKLTPEEMKKRMESLPHASAGG